MSEINMTPLIDLAFALLIIFMITTPLMEQKIKLDLPVKSTSLQPDPEEDFQTLSVNAEGEFFWGKDQVSVEEMDTRLKQLSNRSDPPVLNIRGDRKGPYQNVITLIDLIKKNKLSKISLETKIE